MIAQHVDRSEAPTKPMMKPLSHIEIQDDFRLEAPSSLALAQPSPFKDMPLDTMETEESAFAEEEIDPCSRKRQLNDMFSNSTSKRCMLWKLQRMDRAPIKRRHY